MHVLKTLFIAQYNEKVYENHLPYTDKHKITAIIYLSVFNTDSDCSKHLEEYLRDKAV